MIDLPVDFNTLADDRRRLLADIPHEPVAVGDRVRTHDDDGNTLDAVVHAIDPDSGLLYLEPLWETWASGDDEDDTPLYGKLIVSNAGPIAIMNSSGRIRRDVFHNSGEITYESITYESDTSGIKIRARS
jgi:hypothetical protein